MGQKLENEALRRKFKIDAAVHGILVDLMEPIDPAFPLRSNDVLTDIGTYPINNNGMVELKNGIQVSFLYMVPRIATDEKVPVSVWRQGRNLKLSLPVTTKDKRLVRPYQGEPLDYFFHGPLVFAVGKSDDIALYSQLNRTLYLDNNPLVIRRDDWVRFPDEELVVASGRMFAHRIAKGYTDPVGKVLKEVNGIRIKNLRHLVTTIRDSTNEFLTFRFADNWSETLVFDRKAMEKATEEILEDNGVAANRRGSKKMLKVWTAGKEH
jgi:hypothetical protein